MVVSCVRIPSASAIWRQRKNVDELRKNLDGNGLGRDHFAVHRQPGGTLDWLEQQSSYLISTRVSRRLSEGRRANLADMDVRKGEMLAFLRFG